MPATAEYVEQIVQMMTQAAKANYEQPGRTGVTVTVHSKMADEIMVAGDLHGHRGNFQQIVRAAALDEHPGRHLVMQEVAHGGPTYPNGGCQSHQMLEDVARLKLRYPDRFHFILGNHELSELTGFPILKAGQLLNFVFRLGIESAFGEAAKRVEEAYHVFIRSLPVVVRTPQKIVICHSSPEGAQLRSFTPGTLMREMRATDLTRGGSIFDLVWGRDYTEKTAREFARLMDARVCILGHEPCEAGFAAPNPFQIILDCSRKPAACLTFPLRGLLTQQDLLDRIQTF